MPTLIRRVDGDVIEVTFAKPIASDGPTGAKLEAFAAESPAVTLIRIDGAIAGIECTSKDYINFLQSVQSSRATIQAVRDALDESKKAQRKRMKGDSSPRR